MAVWQYGSLIAAPGSWELVERPFIRKKHSEVHGWVVRWRGPHNQQGTWQLDDVQRIPVEILNNLGGEDWEIVTVFQVEGRVEYLLKRRAVTP